MEHQETSVEIFEKFKWKIANFSQLNNVERIYSEPFVLGRYPWRIYLHPKGRKRDGNLTIYLESVQMQIDNVPKEWSRDVKFKLVVFNQLDTNRTIALEIKDEFNETNRAWGYNSFMPLVDLHDPEKGFIVKDVLIVGAEVFVGKRKRTHENRVSEAASLTGHKSCEDLKVLWEELEELKKNVVAQEHEIKRLKTKPEVKDIKGKACDCEDLQVLWEELEKYRSDLTWLEPHVQSALRIKNYVEKALYVEKLKVDQEIETKRLKTALVAAEENLYMERDLLKAKGI